MRVRLHITAAVRASGWLVVAMAAGCVLALACTTTSSTRPADAGTTCDEAQMVPCCDTMICPWQGCPDLCEPDTNICANSGGLSMPVDGGCSDADPRTACLVDNGQCCGPCDAGDSGTPSLFGDDGAVDAPDDGRSGSD